MDKQIPFYNPEVWGGIECTINRVGHEYFDQLEYAGHYQREDDIPHIAELGIRKVRYPILWEYHQPASDTKIDWSHTEQRLIQLKEKNIDIIAGLVHHGSGPQFTNLLDPKFPEQLAAYARQVAEKFPWINYYTPVNEPLTTARFSGLYGLWYPHHKNNRSFFRMLLNELKATVMAMREIRKINPEAKLVQTEDLGKTYSTKKLAYQAKFENHRRWLTFDILCGKFNSKHPLWKYFSKYAIPAADINFFLDNPCEPDIFGFNHYLTSERFLDENLSRYPSHAHGGNGKHRYADVEAVRVSLDQPTGLKVLVKEAWTRYQKPIAITEVHLHCHREDQLRWFQQVWDVGIELKKEGVDLKAITSWALLGSVGWNKLLTQRGGEYEPGAFDVRSGKLRPTALAKFIKQVADHNKTEHEFSGGQGWWQRSTRLIFQPKFSLIKSEKYDHPPVLILGKRGTLGNAFARVCTDRMMNVILLNRQECDITNETSIRTAIRTYKPWAVINAAGYVRVDDAEDDQENCFAANTVGPYLLAKVCAETATRLVNFSSDLVFDGAQQKPYVESDLVHPLNIYGNSKAKAEELALEAYPDSLMIRTSAFIGPWDKYNFIKYVERSLSQYEEIQVASDLLISPTYLPHLANTTIDLLIDREKGIWHLANKGAITWFELANIAAERLSLDPTLLIATPASELHYKAERPAYSVLGSEKGHILPSLDQALDNYFELGKKNEKVLV